MKGKRTILIICLGLAGFLSSGSKSKAQVYNQNIVGYINLRILSGDNLIANQLLSPNDTLANLFQASTPDGSTFTKWNPSLNQYLPVSTYHTGVGWDINYGLTLGEGGLFHATTAFTNTFVGSIWSGYDFNSTLPDFGQPAITNSGLLLLSCLIPIGGADMFYAVVGRNPNNGESVTTLDGASQLYSTTTFLNDTWDNGSPSLAVGQSAFFNLVNDIAPVPEPPAMAVIGSGAAFLLISRRKWAS